MYRANNHPVTQQLDGGATVTKLCRDSSADRPQPYRRKAKPSDHGTGQQDPTTSQQAQCQAASPAIQMLYCGGRKRARQTHTQALANHGVAMKRRKLLLDALSEQEQLAKWIAARDLAPRAGPSARERMQRVLDNVRQRAVTEKAHGVM